MILNCAHPAMACFSAKSPDSPLTTTISMDGPGPGVVYLAEVDNKAGH